MCTSLIYQSKDHAHFLARTMDFSFELDASPIYLPKGYPLKSNVETDVTFNNKYAFLGAGRKLEEYFFADGLNEKGLSICALYFSDHAAFAPSKETGKINLAPHEFVSWVLGNIASVDELKEEMANIELVSVKNNLLGIVVPLHWIVADQTGASIIIERTTAGLAIYDNEVRVMTNSPDYPWHLTNLDHYSFLTNELIPASTFYNHTPQLRNGYIGLPGDYTSDSRFIRTAFHAEFTDPGETTKTALNSLFHILASVTIPKGVKLKQDHTADYTQYTAIMDTIHLDYYLTPYHDTCPVKITLDDELMSQTEPVVFKLSDAQQFQVLKA